MAICIGEGCSKPGLKRGMCWAHYLRWYRKAPKEEIGKRGRPKREYIACEIAGCERDQYAHGWCKLHYERWKRQGHPETVRGPGEPRVDPIKRFFGFVEKGTSCWEWIGPNFSNGYGLFSLVGKNHGAHRWSYELANGPVPEGKEMDHLCFNKACVNPDHLQAVTRFEHMQRHHGKTECIRGHPLVGPDADVHIRKSGRRDCRRCKREWRAERTAAGLPRT